jgi:hypothetical protein
MNCSECLREHELEAEGITLDDFASLLRRPTEYTALAGSPCWCSDEVIDLLGWQEEGDEL